VLGLKLCVAGEQRLVLRDQLVDARRELADLPKQLVGSLHPNAGGAILAHGETLAALGERVNADPFVAEGIVTVEILEIKPSKTDPRFDFLLP
jgi:hypothetical protein